PSRHARRGEIGRNRQRKGEDGSDPREDKEPNGKENKNEENEEDQAERRSCGVRDDGEMEGAEERDDIHSRSPDPEPFPDDELIAMHIAGEDAVQRLSLDLLMKGRGGQKDAHEDR